MYKTFKYYWKTYGGLYAILTSSYFILSIVLTIVFAAVSEDIRNWRDINEEALSIAPSMLGFSLAGMSVLLAFSNPSFLETIKEGGKEDSFFMQAVVTFFHFIILQITSLFFSLFAKIIDNTEFYFVSTILFVYSVLIGIAVAALILGIARILNASGD